MSPHKSMLDDVILSLGMVTFMLLSGIIWRLLTRGKKESVQSVGENDNNYSSLPSASTAIKPTAAKKKLKKKTPKEIQSAIINKRVDRILARISKENEKAGSKRRKN